MKMTFYANACALYENSKGEKLLCDPWLVDGAFDGAWFHFPPLKISAKDFQDIDYLYLSHLHPDHYDPATLEGLPRNVKVVILDHGLNFLAKMLHRQGFENLVMVKDRESVHLDGNSDGFKVTLFAPFEKHIYHSSELGNLIDSALLVEADGKKILNTNDNLPSISAAHSLAKNYGKFDLVKLNFNAAGPFPSCFLNMSESERSAAHDRILTRNMDHFFDLTNCFEAEAFMPFAGSYVIGGKSWEKNRYLGTTTWDNCKSYLENRGCKTPILVLNEGQTYDFALKSILNGPYIPIDVEKMFEYIRDSLAHIKYDYECDELLERSTANETMFQTLLTSARENLWFHQQKLKIWPDCNISVEVWEGWTFNFNLNSEQFELTKFLSRQDVHKTLPSLVCHLDNRYLLRILRRKAHWNNAEIGCHIDFEREPDHYLPDVHTLMSFFQASNTCL